MKSTKVKCNFFVRCISENTKYFKLGRKQLKNLKKNIKIKIFKEKK